MSPDSVSLLGALLVQLDGSAELDAVRAGIEALASSREAVTTGYGEDVR